MIIDAHQHFWDRTRQSFDYSWQEAPGMEPICRSFLPADLAPLLSEAGVEKSVFVQTQHKLAENDWALELAETHDFVAGVVGWVDLTDPACEDQLLKYKDHPQFVGIRHITQDEPDDDFIVRPDVRRGLSVLQRHRVPFDLLFYARHLKHAATVAAEFPELPLVIDHLAKPNIKRGQFTDWANTLRAAARLPNVFCKLSGMITEADWESWTVAQLRPYVETTLEAFGTERCMFGSDWPVCLLAGSYAQAYHALHEALGPITASERKQIFGATAIQFYGLPV